MIYSAGLFAPHRPGDPALVGAVLVDLTTGDGSRLRRRLAEAGGRWLALTTAERSPDLPSGIAGCADDSPAVRATYAPDGRRRTWLIRPDGYVAACTEPDRGEIQATFLAGIGVADRPAGTGLQR